MTANEKLDAAATPPADRRRSALRIAALVGAPLLAIGIALWATRGDEPEPAGGNGHDHAAMVAGGDTARTVSIGAGDARRIGVTFAPVTFGPLAREVRTVGQVVVDETRTSTIAPRVDGWVERLHVDFTGQAVSRGQPLLALYSPMLVSAQEELLLAHRLAGEMGASDPGARANAEELVRSARRRLALWDVPASEVARIERSGQVQRAIVLRAATGGVVLEKNVTVGQRVMAGDPLYRLADLSTVWVEGEVYEQDLRSVRTGQRATASFDALPGQRFAGRVAYVYPTLSPETRTVRIRVELANPALRLKPGMVATLGIDAASGATLSVPRGAVLVTGERQLVFVRLPGGQLEPRRVQVGASGSERIEILSGVSAGDTVVASATFLIDAESNLGTSLGGMGDMPGMEITVPPAGAPPATPPPADSHAGHPPE